MNMIDVRNYVTCMNCANRYTNFCSRCLNKDEFRAKDRFLEEYIGNFVASNPIDRIVKTCKVTTNYRPMPNTIKDVIFNPPATIILWEDGTKTVVKAQNGEPFDPEKGMAMAIVKKTFDNKGHYYDAIKKFTEPYYEKQRAEAWKNVDEMSKLEDEKVKEAVELGASKKPEKPWRIWVARIDRLGAITSVSHTSFNYSSRSSAVRRAKKQYGLIEGYMYKDESLIGDFFAWRVAQENPFTDASDI